MKNKIAILMIVAMVLMLAGCVFQDKKVEITEVHDTEGVVADDKEDGAQEWAGLPNPWVDSDKAGVLEATGFDMAAPEGADNVAYSYMPSEGMAQMNYTADNAMWVYRIKPADALEDISGINCEWDYIGENKVAGMDAIEYSYASEPQGDLIENMECTRVINWYDAKNKVTYSLAVIGTDLNGLNTPVYAENLFNRHSTQ